MLGPSHAGIDWASREHTLCIVDADGEVLCEGSFPNTEAGIARLIAEIDSRQAHRVAIERVGGILVDRIVEAGLDVFPVHPSKLSASRRRYSGSGRKSDAFDAYCLAELVRTDSHHLRALVPDSDETKTLRALTRAREDMLRRKVQMVRQLRGHLAGFWPGPTYVFPQLDSRVTLAFLRRYPSPAEAEAIDEAAMARFLEEHSSRIRLPPAELLGRLREAPTGTPGPGEFEARRLAILGLVGMLEIGVEEIGTLTKRIVRATRAHPDAEIFFSPFKGTELVIPAQLIVGFGDDRGRYPNADVLAAKAGVVPVAHQSGNANTAVFRSACDRRLRHAVTGLADTTRRQNPWAQAIYAASRERGHRHNQALRVLGRAWLRVLWRCWQDGVPYDPEGHGARHRLEVTGREEG